MAFDLQGGRLGRGKERPSLLCNMQPVMHYMCTRAAYPQREDPVAEDIRRCPHPDCSTVGELPLGDKLGLACAWQGYYDRYIAACQVTPASAWCMSSDRYVHL